MSTTTTAPTTDRRTTAFRSDLPDVQVGGDTVHAVIAEACRRHPTRTAIVDEITGVRLTYAEMARHADRIAASLADRGARAGDVIAIWGPNSLPWVTGMLGALAAGCIVTGVSPLATDEEAAQHFDVSGASLALVHAAFATRPIVKTPPTGVEMVAIGAGPGTAYDDLLATGAASPDPQANAGDIALLPFSSGTTGLPKGVELTHAALVTMLRQTTVTLAPTKEDVVLALPPFPHVMGSVLTLLLPLSAGACVVTVSRFEPDRFLPSIVEHGVTVVTVPPLLAPFLSHHPAATPEALATVRLIAFGGAPLSADAEGAVVARHPHAFVGQGWGMTELAVGASTPRFGRPTRPGAVGQLLPNTELRVVDPVTGTDVGADEVGELWVRGPQTMRGYRGLPDATAAVLDEDGWVHTGDLGRIDRDDWIHVVDRIKDLIKVKGYQVAPAELEAVLIQHPGVADAAVTRALVDGEERPVGYIVSRGDIDPDAVATWLADRVAPYKRLAAIHAVKQLPRTPSGKLLRRALPTTVTP